ncbi:acyltransferase family protein [Actinomadura sp. DC4]|uniref:acyltransferase family protein n=1 Tax=Actinomadura sp. DC4 TaxID=3055069 RepID=UPI0025B12CA2|nr:acyltransferase family protein [Actinomadura sp. DC4]MDN3356180.1 acyltransferase family protein [Actinomadura sp. DC4]
MTTTASAITTTTVTGPAATAPAPPPAGSRDPYFDNAKFLAVVLVVIGHAWEPLRAQNVGGRVLEAAQTFVYAFHLPVFIVMCGYFSRGFTAGRDRTRKLVAAIIVPYVIFSVAYPLWAGLLAGNHVGWDPLEPYYLTWFMPALLLWRLSTPLWQQLRYPITAALVISMIAGFVTLPSMLNAAQVLSFLPFFVIGLTLRPHHFAFLRRRAMRAAGAALLVAGGGAAYAAALTVDPEWVHWRRSFVQLGVGEPAGVGFRLIALGAAVALTVGFLAVVPGRRTWFTRFGSASMYVYLLHGFVTLFLSYQGWYYRVSGPEVVLVTVGCGALAVVLSSGAVRGAFRWAVEPRMDWLFQPRTPAVVSTRVVKNDAEHVPAAGPDLAHAVPHRDPPEPPRAGHRTVPHREDQPLADPRPGDDRP